MALICSCTLNKSYLRFRKLFCTVLAIYELYCVIYELCFEHAFIFRCQLCKTNHQKQLSLPPLVALYLKIAAG